MKHTKGNWKVSEDRYGSNYNESKQIGTLTIVSEVGDTDCWVADAHKFPKISKEEWEANAKLISSAPDLLDALKLCLDALENEVTPNFNREDFLSDTVYKAQEAIKKATS